MVWKPVYPYAIGFMTDDGTTYRHISSFKTEESRKQFEYFILSHAPIKYGDWYKLSNAAEITAACIKTVQIGGVCYNLMDWK